MNARESFARLLLAEWTKLRSVTRWVVTLLGAVALTIGLSYLAASGNRTDINEHEGYISGPHGDPVADSFYFVHQQISGDTTLTVRVASLTAEPQRPSVRIEGEQLTRLDDPSPFAQPAAGIIIKDGTQRGTSYASVMLTAEQGVRMQWDFGSDRQGGAGGGPRWLRLVRSGGTITGYESTDGAVWRKIAEAQPKALPSTVEIGMFVSSPESLYVGRGGGSSTVGQRLTKAQATFDNVQLGSGGQWHGDRLGNAGASSEKGEAPPIGGFTETDGVFAVTGAGKIGPRPPDDDMVEGALIGVVAGLMALIALGVLYATSEYRRGMIRTTFTAVPRRGRVLAAKAIVLAVTSFLAGLAGAVGSFVLAIPVLIRQGFTPPAFPAPSLMDGQVQRALLLTAAFMAGVALVGLGIGVLLRHSAAAITITVVLILGPLIVGTILPGNAPKWLMYTTLAGGMATQRAKPPTVTLAEPWAMIGPWAGLGAVAAWVAVTLGLAWWRLRRRDA